MNEHTITLITNVLKCSLSNVCYSFMNKWEDPIKAVAYDQVWNCMKTQTALTLTGTQFFVIGTLFVLYVGFLTFKKCKKIKSISLV